MQGALAARVNNVKRSQRIYFIMADGRTWTEPPQSSAGRFCLTDSATDQRSRDLMSLGDGGLSVSLSEITLKLNVQNHCRVQISMYHQGGFWKGRWGGMIWNLSQSSTVFLMNIYEVPPTESSWMITHRNIVVTGIRWSPTQMVRNVLTKLQEFDESLKWWLIRQRNVT